MGHGDKTLGQKILATFLRKSPVMKDLTAIVLYNSGVKLVVAGSPVLSELTQLHEAGVELRPCGTCLDYYQLKPAISGASNMDEIIRELDQAEKVITL
jgi:intracellular sulfur oxidation DsrE/DsrF family protein